MNRSKQLLLAEDNLADVYLVRHALRLHEVDCEVLVLPDGQEAVAYIDQLDADDSLRCPDLLLLDLHIPRHDGNEVLRHLRASKRCPHLPVLVLTSSDSPRDRKCAEANTVLEYFRKPTDLDQFIAIGARVKEILFRKA